MGKIAPFVFVRPGSFAGRIFFARDNFLVHHYIKMASSQAFLTSADFSSSQVDKLKRKAQDAPFVPLGIAGMVGAMTLGVGWMLLNDHILKKPSERVAAKH